MDTLASESSPEPSVTISGTHAGMTMGNLDADGNADLVLFDVPGTPGTASSLYSTAHVFNGFHPLSPPWTRVESRIGQASRLTIAAGAEGQPMEMRLSGDCIAPPPLAWVPYAERARITLNPTEGAKRVTIAFRNRQGRESIPLSVDLDLIARNDSIRTITNRGRSGAPIRVECALPAGGRLRAEVRTLQGLPVRVMHDGDAAPGAVAPGVYVLRVERPGGTERQRVLLTAR